VDSILEKRGCYAQPGQSRIKQVPRKQVSRK